MTFCMAFCCYTKTLRFAINSRTYRLEDNAKYIRSAVEHAWIDSEKGGAAFNLGIGTSFYD